MEKKKRKKEKKPHLNKYLVSSVKIHVCYWKYQVQVTGHRFLTFESRKSSEADQQ